MGKTEFKKDKTPYYVFACSKCWQYSYVKTTQKTKKCLRCGRMHRVKNLESISEMINGIMAAKDRVMVLQDEFARKEFGFEPVFRADSDFYFNVLELKKGREQKQIRSEGDKNDDSNFKKILDSVQKQYKKYPYYLIEFAAQDKGLSKEDVKLMLIEFLNKGFLKKTREGLYYLPS